MTFSLSYCTEFVVVHNGIITNYKDIKKFLVSFAIVQGNECNDVFLSFQIDRGYVFESDTDTEVIPKLLRYLYYSQV